MVHVDRDRILLMLFAILLQSRKGRLLVITLMGLLVETIWAESFMWQQTRHRLLPLWMMDVWSDGVVLQEVMHLLWLNLVDSLYILRDLTIRI